MLKETILFVVKYSIAFGLVITALHYGVSFETIVLSLLCAIWATQERN